LYGSDHSDVAPTIGAGQKDETMNISGKLSSDFVRRHWRDVVDYVVKGEHVVVNRSGKPLVAIIPYEDFRALIEELEDLHDSRRLTQIIDDYRRNPTGDPAMERLLALREEAEREDEPQEQLAQTH
jgi:prevent-host-death family protein